MDDLLETIEKLQDTQAAIRRAERAAAEYPDLPSVALSLRSLQERHQALESAFSSLADEQWFDICSYKVLPEKDGRVTLPSLTSSLGDFQALFTLVYDTIKNGPKQRGRASPEATAATTFAFGYSFTGSVGFVLTLPNERLLVDETDLDRAMHTVFEMARAESSDQIAVFAKELGAAPIRTMYKWATDHVRSGLSVDIDWRREEQVKSKLFIQVPELENLQHAIAATSDEVEETLTVTGLLVGAHVHTHSFHMELEDGSEIRGKMAEGIGSEYTVELPRRYTAHILKTTQINYATEEDIVTYYLLSLRD
jgi:hypothetical protein